MADKIPTFEWNSEESEKEDCHVFEVALQSHLETRQCRFVLDNNAIAINTPINPGPEPPGVVDAREWRKLYQTFWVEQKKFYAFFDTAIGILQSMLINPSKAAMILIMRSVSDLQKHHKQNGQLTSNFKLLWQS
jgi:hypothetical protein